VSSIAAITTSENARSGQRISWRYR
jgi:hypothetical protein